MAVVFFFSSIEESSDQEFIMRIYDNFNKRMLGYAYKLTQDVTLTQDIVQSVFLAIINKIEKFKQMPGDEIAPYIFTIVRNESLHRIKANAREVEFEPARLSVASDFDLEKYVVNNLEVDTMKRALKQLPERFRMVIMLKYWMRLSHKEIAVEMHTSESSSQNLLAKAISALKRQLSEVMKDEEYSF